jgi:hypothetical protein
VGEAAVAVAVAGRGVTDDGAQAVSSTSKPNIKKSAYLPLAFMDSFYPISTAHPAILRGLDIL